MVQTKSGHPIVVGAEYRVRFNGDLCPAKCVFIPNDVEESDLIAAVVDDDAGGEYTELDWVEVGDFECPIGMEPPVMPKRFEFYLNIDEDDQVNAYDDKDDANDEANSDRIECLKVIYDSTLPRHERLKVIN